MHQIASKLLGKRLVGKRAVRQNDQYWFLRQTFVENTCEIMWGMMKWPTTWRPWATTATNSLLRSATCCLWPTRTQWDLVVLLGASFQVWSRRRNPRAMRRRRAMQRTTASRWRMNSRRSATLSCSSWTRVSFPRPRSIWFEYDVMYEQISDQSD